MDNTEKILKEFSDKLLSMQQNFNDFKTILQSQLSGIGRIKKPIIFLPVTNFVDTSWFVDGTLYTFNRKLFINKIITCGHIQATLGNYAGIRFDLNINEINYPFCNTTTFVDNTGLANIPNVGFSDEKDFGDVGIEVNKDDYVHLRDIIGAGYNTINLNMLIMAHE